jgi:hypothetical protein
MPARFLGLSLFAFTSAGCSWEWEPIDWDAPPSRAAKAVRVPSPIEPQTDGDILQHYAARPDIRDLEPRTWELPYQAQRLAIAMLIIAAKDRPDQLPLVLTPDARWGYPDRREFGATPVFGADGGEAFIAALRIAAQRLPAKSRWKTAPVAPGVQPFVRSGAEPMWISVGTGSDAIIVRERVVGGMAQIEYVGFFVEPPSEPIQVYGRPAIPPLVAPPRRRSEAHPLEDVEPAEPGDEIDMPEPQ